MESEASVDVIFVIESTFANDAFFKEMKVNYIIPTLEYFSQLLSIEERDFLFYERYIQQYGIVLYGTAAESLGPVCTTFGPYSSHQTLMETLDQIKLVDGGKEPCANLAEGFATAHVCFDEMMENRKEITTDNSKPIHRHCILVCHSAPYSSPVKECWAYAGKTLEQMASLFHDRNINLSIIAPRKVPVLYKLFMKADGEQVMTVKNYAKDVRHLVLLKGYNLKELPAQMCPTTVSLIIGQQIVVAQTAPITNIQSQQNTLVDNNNQITSQSQVGPISSISITQPQQQSQANNTLNQQLLQQQQFVPSQNSSQNTNLMQNTNYQPQGNRWMFNANQQPSQNQIFMSSPSLNSNGINAVMAQLSSSSNISQNPNSALISQLSTPPNQNISPIMQQQQQLRMQMISQQQHQQQVQQQQSNNINVSTSGSTPGSGSVQSQSPGLNNQAQNAVTNHSNPAPSSDQTLMRDKIWSGTLEWVEKMKTDLSKVARSLQCTITSSIKDGEPEIKAINWPSKMFMQLMPKQLVGNIGGHYFKDSKTVILKPQPCEASEALAKSMTTLFAGCVHITNPTNMPPSDIKVLILLYIAEKNAFLGFIPNNQSMFVERLRKVIQQKQSMGLQQTASTSAMQQQQHMQNSMNGQIQNSVGSNVINSPQQASQHQQPQQQQQDPQQQHYSSQYSAQQQMSMQMPGTIAGQMGSSDQVVAAGPMQQQQQMSMMQHQRMPMMGANHTNSQIPPQHSAVLQQQQQRMIRPMMTNNPGLRHLLQQQPGSGSGQFRPQINVTGPGMPIGPNQMSSGPGGPLGSVGQVGTVTGSNRSFDENNFDFL